MDAEHDGPAKASVPPPLVLDEAGWADQVRAVDPPLLSARTVPPTPMTPRTPSGRPVGFTPLICVVDFHHARGPEVEMWFGADEDHPDPAVQYDWPLLPFMALSDGAHASTEDFSYFTLLRPTNDGGATTPSALDAPTAPATPAASATSLFGISCTRQIDATLLRNRPPEVTRSTVQKAVVVITDSPQFFGMLRERLSIVTTAWFDQRDFTDVDILRRFQEALAEEKARGGLGPGGEDEDRDQYLGMSLRELVHEFRWQTLVLLKCCLLQPKMLFFGSRCERLCMMQFSLISLIPGLLRNLQDCASPELDSYARRMKQPTSLRTSDRNSLLAYMGLPLQIFGKGSLFGPYTPLQQLDVLADFGTKSYVVGSTNSLLLQQRDRYSDILVNLDEMTVNVTSTSLRTALQLSVPDRRWIDFITQEVNDTWDESNPGRPKTMGYVGSEEFIRLQFEEYLLSLISSVKYHNYITSINSRTGRPNLPPLPHIEGDPSSDFGNDFIEYWSRTGNYQLWQANTDSHLFEFVEPRHPCAGGLSVDDVQRRIAQQVQDMHLDERFAQGREVIGRNLAAGREKASTMFNKFYADMETMREAQRKRAEEAKLQQAQESGEVYANGAGDYVGSDALAQTISNHSSSTVLTGGDAYKTPPTAQSVGGRATAYMSSWASWAGEKRKAAGWGSRLSGTGSITSIGSSTGGNGAAGSWSLLGNGANRRGNRSTMSSMTSDASSERGVLVATNGSDIQSPRMSVSSFATGFSEVNESAPLTTAPGGTTIRSVPQRFFHEAGPDKDVLKEEDVGRVEEEDEDEDDEDEDEDKDKDDGKDGTKEDANSSLPKDDLPAKAAVVEQTQPADETGVKAMAGFGSKVKLLP
ncbi:lalv9 family protein [Grosmannia clavigera kw1407]|uniref:Lalv9 family protein n=1 Tax=Grosmannia clavigera (strain kw1407 / UAMH 11150) TaxID=655863 RepID=F0XFC9_GROCL|nr:lalv9 family protein [Grosmannia clavigera kw1407]EFX03647.1 lalv9 family protein [Grosmannia clavigera kw1407]